MYMLGYCKVPRRHSKKNSQPVWTFTLGKSVHRYPQSMNGAERFNVIIKNSLSWLSARFIIGRTVHSVLCKNRMERSLECSSFRLMDDECRPGNTCRILQPKSFVPVNVVEKVIPRIVSYDSEIVALQRTTTLFYTFRTSVRSARSETLKLEHAKHTSLWFSPWINFLDSPVRIKQ